MFGTPTMTNPQIMAICNEAFHHEANVKRIVVEQEKLHLVAGLATVAKAAVARIERGETPETFGGAMTELRLVLTTIERAVDRSKETITEDAHTLANLFARRPDADRGFAALTAEKVRERRARAKAERENG